MKRAFLVAALALLGGVALGAKAAEPGVSITIYKSPTQRYNQYGQYEPTAFGVISERRKVNLQAGANDVRFAGVAAQTDATTVHLQDLTDPGGTVVGEQSFEYDLASTDKLLSRYIGSEVTVVTENGEITGKLLSFDATQLVVETNDQKMPIRILDLARAVRDIRFGAAPGGLVTTPTLSWKVNAKKGGEHVLGVTYQAGGLSWSADYTVVVSADGKKLDLSGWVTVTNQTGVDFADAAIKLVYGDIYRAGQQQVGQPVYDPYTGQYTYPQAAPDPVTYELPHRATVPKNGSRQIELFSPVTGLAGGRVFVHEATPQYKDYWKQNGHALVDRIYGEGQYVRTELSAYLEIGNAQKKLALPPGRVRVYVKDEKDGALTLKAEEQVTTASKDGSLRVRQSAAQDVSVDRKIADWRNDGRELRERYEFTIKNSNKNEAVDVLITEYGWRWKNWRLENESHAADKLADGERFQYRVNVPKGGSATLSYEVVYTLQ